MQPDQPYAPNQGNQYDFIVNPGAPKKPLIPTLGGGSFTKKIIFIVGGAVLLMAVLWLAVSIFGGSDINKAQLVGLTQVQEEIARVSQKGEDATDQAVRNVAANTNLSVRTQQKAWLDFLAGYGVKVSPQERALKQNDATDTKLDEAKANNTYDPAFRQIMEKYLNDYLKQLETDTKSAGSAKQKELLKAHYDQTKLLLEQLSN